MKHADSAQVQMTSLLNNALARLKQQNELASVRSIAAHVDVSSSFLSKVFRGERKFPTRLLEPLSTVLRMDAHELAELRRLIVLDYESTELPANGAPNEKVQNRSASGDGVQIATAYSSIGKNQYWMLEDWFHIPILNLTTTIDFTPAPEQIAKRLGISTAQVRATLERFLEEGLLTRANDGQIERTELKLRLPTDRSYASVREYHKRMIKKTIEHLESATSSDEFKNRLVSGISFAGDPARLPQAQLILERAMYEAAEHLAGGESTEVFQLNLQLFKVTK